MGVKYWRRIFSEVIADYICNHPEMSLQEARLNLYKSPETEAGEIWNALVIKMTT